MEREEAIQILRNRYAISLPCEKEAIETLIPELRESEDERVIKGLENFLWCIANGGMNDRGTMPSAEMCQKWLAYLEKQKTYKPNDEDEIVRKRLIDYFESLRVEHVTTKWEGLDIQSIIAYLEKQRELPFVKDVVLGYPGLYFYDGERMHFQGSPATEKNPYDFAMSQQEEKQKEQIPYIDFVIKPHKGDDNNPYDMQVSEAQEYAIKRGFGFPFNDGEVYVDERHLTQTIGNILRWADEHPKEQKPVGWSEQDKAIVCCIACYLDGQFISEGARRQCQEWFNRHRRDFLSSHSWKPSEEQMDALNYAIAEWDGGKRLEGLYALRNDLKKLI